jgi:putative multiple sugar transport system permease protein
MQGYAYQVDDAAFLSIFGGGDSCYIPDFLAGIGPDAGINKTCMVFAVLVAVGYAIFTFINRSRLIAKGYKVDAMTTVIIKTVLIVAVVIWLGYKLASYKGIPTVLIWIALVLGIFAYITSKTTLGRNLYAVGGNEKATRLSGINTKMVMFSAYTLMGLLSGFAGILNIARLMGSQPTYGMGYEMDAIAACFIGGASAYGGTGTIGGVIIGAALCGIINQGMVIANTPPNYQTVVKGLVLLVAVLFDVIMQMRRKGSKKTDVSAEKGGAKA